MHVLGSPLSIPRLNHRARCSEVGRAWGGEPLRWGFQANENPPKLRTHDRYGNRIDEVEFHPAWHGLVELGVENGIHARPWRTPAPEEFRDWIDVAEWATMCAAGFPEPRTFSIRVARDEAWNQAFVLAAIEDVPNVATFTGVDREAVVGATPDLVLAAGNNLTAPADIANEDVEHAVLSELQYTAIMVAARRLFFIALIRGFRCGVILEGAQHDQVEIERQAFPIPDETIDAIA